MIQVDFCVAIYGHFSWCSWRIRNFYLNFFICRKNN